MNWQAVHIKMGRAMWAVLAVMNQNSTAKASDMEGDLLLKSGLAGF